MLKLFGLKQCDTTKKGIKHLENNQINYTFIDIKTTVLTDEQLTLWLAHEKQLINKRSTTYRNIKSEWEKAKDLKDKLTIIKANPTLLKRPILGSQSNQLIDIICIGYDEKIYNNLSS